MTNIAKTPKVALLASLYKSPERSYEKKWKVIISGGMLSEDSPYQVPEPTAIYLGPGIPESERRKILNSGQRKQFWYTGCEPSLQFLGFFLNLLNLKTINVFQAFGFAIHHTFVRRQFMQSNSAKPPLSNIKILTLLSHLPGLSTLFFIFQKLSYIRLPVPGEIIVPDTLIYRGRYAEKPNE